MRSLNWRAQVGTARKSQSKSLKFITSNSNYIHYRTRLPPLCDSTPNTMMKCGSIGIGVAFHFLVSSTPVYVDVSCTRLIQIWQFNFISSTNCPNRNYVCCMFAKNGALLLQIIADGSTRTHQRAKK